MVNNLVRITNNCIIQFNEIIKHNIFEQDIYAVKSNNDKSIQLLNENNNLNNIDNSYSPYQDNVLLKQTPYPYFTNEYLINNSLRKNVNADIEDMEYQKISLNYISGFNYSDDDYISIFRFYYIIDNDINFTVCSFVDYKSNSKLKPNSVNIVSDNAIFNNSIDIEIINIQQLLQSDNKEIIKLRNELFNSDKQHSCSELFIEHSIIKNSQIIDFEIDNKQYQKFFIENLNKSYYNRSLDLNEELFIEIENQKNEFDNYISIVMKHSKYDLKSYLRKYLTEIDEFDIKYEITQTSYTHDNKVLSSISQVIQNFSSPYNPVLYKILITDDLYNKEKELIASYMVLDIRCIATTSRTNLQIMRYGKFIINNILSYFFKTIFKNQNPLKVYSKKEIINHDVKMKSDLPNVIQIIKPYFIFTQEQDEIKLLPYNMNIAIDYPNLDSSLNINLITINFDSRIYNCIKYENNKLIFNISESEYSQKTSKYYIKYNGEVMSFGNVIK